jgi:hypothetical protein
LNSVQMPAKQVSGRSALKANQTTSFFLAIERHEATAFRL